MKSVYELTDAISPFVGILDPVYLCANDFCFAIFDRFPVSPGHVLVITRRVVLTYFDCTATEQAALMELVGEVKKLLDERLDPKPDGYNVGFNAGTAAGQTVPHVHVHVIPRYSGDMPDPRGGVRHVIPEKGNYLAGPATAAWLSLTTGPDRPLWPRLADRLPGASEIDLLASFVRPARAAPSPTPAWRRSPRSWRAGSTPSAWWTSSTRASTSRWWTAW